MDPGRRGKLGLRRFSETIWPGAPIWAPASALAAALLVGAGIGAAWPAMTQAEPVPGFSLERTASFSLLSPDHAAGGSLDGRFRAASIL